MGKFSCNVLAINPLGILISKPTIEKKIAGVLRILGREVEAEEIERRIASVIEIIED